jgi:plasmid stabilization system protein ParE
VARLELSPELADDMDRIADHLMQHEVAQVETRLRGILDAIDVLRDNPLIGRRYDENVRELVIGRRSHGYLALYEYVTEIDTVFVLAVRAQRESGYARAD